MDQKDIKRVEEVEARIGYEFRNKHLLLQALTRKAYSNEHPECPHNDEFEHLGDRLLNLLVTEHLCLSNSTVTTEGTYIFTETAGDMSEVEQKLLSNEEWARRMEALGIMDYVRYSRGEDKQSCGSTVEARGNVFEAIIGAVYLDSGRDLNVTREVAYRMFGY